MSRIHLGSVGFRDLVEDVPAEIVVSSFPPDLTLLFFDVGDDCEIALNPSRLVKLVKVLANAAEVANQDSSEWIGLEAVPYAFSDRAVKSQQGDLVISASADRVKLAILSAQQANGQILAATFDRTATLELLDVLKRVKPGQRST